MVLKGGEGNDTIYAGGFDDNDSDDDISNHSIDYEDLADEDGAIYLYGGDGHDKLVGADEVEFQYFFGGEGDDFIQGGNQDACSECTEGEGLFYVDGGDGDDIIKPYPDYEDLEVA